MKQQTKGKECERCRYGCGVIGTAAGVSSCTCPCHSSKQTKGKVASWEKLEEISEYLGDCAGCTYDKDEGTHFAITKQHWIDCYIKPLLQDHDKRLVEKAYKMAQKEANIYCLDYRLPQVKVAILEIFNKVFEALTQAQTTITTPEGENENKMR